MWPRYVVGMKTANETAAALIDMVSPGTTVIAHRIVACARVTAVGEGSATVALCAGDRSTLREMIGRFGDAAKALATRVTITTHTSRQTGRKYRMVPRYVETYPSPMDWHAELTVFA